MPVTPERLEYQKQYNSLNKDKIKQYQKEYFQKRKAEKNKDKVKPILPVYKIVLLERLITKRYKQFLESKKVVKEPVTSYNSRIIQKELHALPQPKPFSGFIPTKSGFVLTW